MILKYSLMSRQIKLISFVDIKWSYSRIISEQKCSPQTVFVKAIFKN